MWQNTSCGIQQWIFSENKTFKELLKKNLLVYNGEEIF